MFYYISGTLATAEPSYAVIDAGGVGYKLTISQTTYDSLPPHLSVSVPPTVKLYTYMSVREDGVELFGFYSEDELSTFKLLISVSGVGPKVALSVLSYFNPEKFALVVASEDVKALSKASGVGAKTAARIVLELKDKISKDQLTGDLASLKDLPTAKAPAGAASGKLREAEDALGVLGYSRAEIAAVLRDLDTAALSLEDIIKAALRRFSEK